MKRLLTILFLLFATVFVHAQGMGGAAATPAVTGKISGIILDSVTRTPIDYATVSLGRAGSTKTTNGALTDEKGSFKIENISAGIYRLTIAFLGYQTKIIDSVKTTLAKPDLNLGKI